MALAVLALDQITKYLVEQNLPLGRSVPVLGEVLTLLYVRNPGAAFSFAAGYTWIFSIAAAAVTVFIVVFARRIRSMSWAILFGMLLGGTVGNLIDRLFREPSFGVGHVVDFIQVAINDEIGFPAIFNIADSFIVASMGLFIILTIRGVGLDGTRAVPDDGSEGAGRSDAAEVVTQSGDEHTADASDDRPAVTSSEHDRDGVASDDDPARP